MASGIVDSLEMVYVTKNQAQRLLLLDRLEHRLPEGRIKRTSAEEVRQIVTRF